ncbi:MAG: flippase-like domain-containing protein [Deltaproteobacteria bacterium]|uniref:Flippase-like domain-containing protein n=1 Tax=Candidatus Desulfacyla euxinica TaxID=2841693 RepID=A0A8J6MXE4_9DELT|nr:flippase-like domain-containing protein [Candidatus Desulfacyla euxinica]MBL7217248.1 flippase-like domain-containing protein [Desulfobacteraceae bacterium]
MRKDIRRKAGNLIRIGISAGLLIWLFSRFDLKGVLTYFENLQISIWVVACLMSLVAQVLSSMRWWILSNTFSFPGRWSTYLGFYFVGMFFNLFLPTGIGGDLFKIHFLSREKGRRFLAAFTVVGDRFFGLITMLFMGAAAVKIWPDLLPEPFRDFLYISALIILAALLGLPFFQRVIKGILPGFSRHLEGLLILWQRPQRLFAVLGLSFCLQALGIGAIALLGAGIGIKLPLSFYFASLPLVFIITLIPISFNGIGVREGAFIYFFGLKGVEAEPALGLGLLFFSVQVALSLLGGVAYAAGLHRRSIMKSA